MLVYSILTNKHSLKKGNTEPDESLLSINTDTLHTTCQSPHVSNASCLSFTVDLTWFPLRVELKHTLFKTSSAAGWKRSGVSGASPPRGAPCCASRSLVSLGSHGSAADMSDSESLLHTRGTVTNPVCSAGLNLTGKVRTGFFLAGFCLPCQEFLTEEYQLVASCWRCRRTCWQNQMFQIKSKFQSFTWSKSCVGLP